VSIYYRCDNCHSDEPDCSLIRVVVDDTGLEGLGLIGVWHFCCLSCAATWCHYAAAKVQS
jgi:hypothetical protein